jgi:hypothetical protein
MSIAKKDDYQISLEDAVLWTTIWRIANPENAKAYLIPVEDLVDTLKEMGVLSPVGDPADNNFHYDPGKTQQDVRAYMAIDPHIDNPKQGPEEKILLVGTNKRVLPNGKVVYEDIINFPDPSGLGDGDGKDSGVYDFSEPCPNTCDEGSPLNGGG